MEGDVAGVALMVLMLYSLGAVVTLASLSMVSILISWALECGRGGGGREGGGRRRRREEEEEGGGGGGGGGKASISKLQSIKVSSTTSQVMCNVCM